MKYRIKKYSFKFAETVFVAQYRVLWIWMYIKADYVGSFTAVQQSYCESFKDAQDRIQTHRRNSIIGKNWMDKKVETITEI